MIELTEKEKEIFEKKKKLVRDCIEVFGNSDIFNNGFLFRAVNGFTSKGFTVKEMLDLSFVDLYREFSKVNQFTKQTELSNLFTYSIQRSKILENNPGIEIKDLENLIVQAINYFEIDKFEATSFNSNPISAMLSAFKYIANVKTTSGESVGALKLFNILIENKFIERTRARYKIDIITDVFESFIDELISNYPIENPEEFIKVVQKTFPEYRNFPLIVINKNISDENKEKIIKASFRQKDLPGYKAYFRKNLSDLNSLKIFINATIINNNRVREKEQNLIDIIKDIFISGERINSNDIFNRISFATEFKDYFNNPEFIEKIFKRTVRDAYKNTYRKEEGFSFFLSIATSNLENDKFLKFVLKSGLYISNFVSEKISSILYSALNEDDKDSVNDIIKIYSKWSRDDANKFLTYITSFRKKNNNKTEEIDLVGFINKYSATDLLDEFLGNIQPFMFKTTDRYNAKNRWHESNEYVFNINDKFFSSEVFSKILNKTTINKLNISAEKIFNYNPQTILTMNSISGRFVKNIEEARNEFLNALNYKTVSCHSPDFDKAVIEKFFKYFEDSSITDIFLSDLISINSNENTKYVSNSYSYNSNTNNLLISSATDILKNICKVGIEYYDAVSNSDISYKEHSDTFYNNLNDVINSLSILSNI